MKFCLATISKINLALEIRGVLPDGRHELSTWFQAIDYGDRLEGEILETGIELECDRPDLCPVQENLAWRAADLLARESGCGKGVRLVLSKGVPSGAGLGGGSGDAAAALCLCHRLWGLDWEVERLEALGAQLGADVPFLVRGGAAWGSGAGDLLEASTGLHPETWILVVTPPVGVNTGWAYRTWDELAMGPLPESSPVTNLRDLRSRDHFRPGDLRGRLHNSFEFAVNPRVPEVAQVRREMDEAGAVAALLSGSGSSVFGLFEEPSAPREILERWSARGAAWRWCRPVGADESPWGVVKR